LSVTDAQLPVRRNLTEEDLALLRHADLVDEGAAGAYDEELSHPGPPGFRERLTRGDISW
jgi:hypothetical protein